MPYAPRPAYLSLVTDVSATEARTLPPHPVPYSVALADGTARFAPDNCELCSSSAVAEVRSRDRAGWMFGRRLCFVHVREAARLGAMVTYDAGYVVAE